MTKASNYSIEPNKELKVIKRRLEELSLFSQAKGGGYRFCLLSQVCWGTEGPTWSRTAGRSPTVLAPLKLNRFLPTMKEGQLLPPAHSHFITFIPL